MNSKEHIIQQIVELTEAHNQLDKQIAEGYSNYLNDPDLSKIKLEKLVIKRKINELSKKVNDEKNV